MTETVDTVHIFQGLSYERSSYNHFPDIVVENGVCIYLPTTTIYEFEVPTLKDNTQRPARAMTSCNCFRYGSGGILHYGHY